MIEKCPESKLVFWVLTIIIICIMGLVFKVVYPYDLNCLEKKAEEYCKSINTSLSYDTFYNTGDKLFYCYNANYSQRTRTGSKYLSYYFIEEELQECER